MDANGLEQNVVLSQLKQCRSHMLTQRKRRQISPSPGHFRSNAGSAPARATVFSAAGSLQLGEREPAAMEQLQTKL